MTQTRNDTQHIIIAGDAPQQLFLFPSDTTEQRPRAYWFHVGTELLAQFLLDGQRDMDHQVRIHKPEPESAEHGTIHSILELDDASSSLPTCSKRTTFKPRRVQQIDMERRWHFPPRDPLHKLSSSSLVIFQETNTDKPVPKESVDGAVAFFKQCRPRFLIYHMARRLCNGEIWNTVRQGPLVDLDNRDPERLIVIVEADDLRAEGVQLSHGLSWEKTCEDFVEQLGSVGKLVSLATCAHLIVLFGCSGVIHHQGAQVAKPTLLFDPLCAEGEFLRNNMGYIPGVADAFVAGFTKGLVQSDLSVEGGIEFGLQAARRLAAAGLAEPGATPSLATVYRAPEVMRALEGTEKSKLVSFSIPSDDIARASDPDWSLLDYTIGDPAEVARQIVKKGFSSANQVPLARFNRLVLFDRREIESFQTIHNLLTEYFLAPMQRPLCIALFGPRGSGKAFAALQVAEAASKQRNARTLRFNLSQFTSVDDLRTAFHSIRDLSLSGSIALVYFNGFDSNLAGSPLGWLPHLLAVMFSGTFSDHGISRPVGTAVFFFGATSIKTYEDLRRKIARAAPDAGSTGHIQEFLTYLHGFVNVSGPNKADRSRGSDTLYPVRRAVILRTLLERREKRLISGEEINIDDGVLNALLLVPKYRQGIRSLKSIIDMSKLNGRYSFERSSLPPPLQLDLHVDHSTFMRYLDGTPLPDKLREKLAEALHKVYSETQNAGKDGPVPWNETAEENKESSRAHADSIPSKLRKIGCFLSEKQEGRTPVTEFTEADIDFLGQIEHDRWNSEKLRNQWGKGEERDPKNRKTPFLKPWDDLDQETQAIDRDMVASYPRILISAAHYIYKLGSR